MCRRPSRNVSCTVQPRVSDACGEDYCVLISVVVDVIPLPEEERRGGDIIDGGVLCYCLFFIAVRCSIIEEEGKKEKNDDR